MTAANPRAVIGDNAPPADPFTAYHAHIGDLFDEASNFLDGSGVNSDAEAEAVSKLLDLIRTAAKDADKARAAEKKPHDDAAKIVQIRWKPLLDRADLAVETCKKALAPWLQAKEAAQRAAAATARAEADAAAEAARIAMRAADVTDLAARERAEGLVKEAEQANLAAARADKARPQATGGARTTTLRTTYRPELIDASAALKHFVTRNPGAVKAFLVELAITDVRAGIRSIPGFSIIEDRSVV